MNPNDPIDAVLNALRDAPPPAGLEDRLLQSLSEQSQLRVPHVSPLRRGWIATISKHRPWIALSTLTTATALGVFLTITHFPHKPAPNSVLSTHAAPSPVISTHAAPSPVLSTHAAPNFALSTHAAPHLVISTGAQRSGEIPAFTAANSASTSRPTQNSPTQNSKLNKPPIPTPTPTPDPYQQAALEDTLAPSHPAPQLPLTRQERILLRSLHHVRYTELAELDPNVRALRDERETAAFQDFFRPPPPIPQAPLTEDPTARPGEKQ